MPRRERVRGLAQPAAVLPSRRISPPSRARAEEGEEELSLPLPLETADADDLAARGSRG